MAAVGRWRGEKWERNAGALADEELKLVIGKGDVGRDEVEVEETLSSRHSAVAVACARDLSRGERGLKGLDESIFEDLRGEDALCVLLGNAVK